MEHVYTVYPYNLWEITFFGLDQGLWSELGHSMFRFELALKFHPRHKLNGEDETRFQFSFTFWTPFLTLD